MKRGNSFKLILLIYVVLRLNITVKVRPTSQFQEWQIVWLKSNKELGLRINNLVEQLALKAME